MGKLYLTYQVPSPPKPFCRRAGGGRYYTDCTVIYRDVDDADDDGHNYGSCGVNNKLNIWLQCMLC